MKNAPFHCAKQKASKYDIYTYQVISLSEMQRYAQCFIVNK